MTKPWEENWTHRAELGDADRVLAVQADPKTYGDRSAERPVHEIVVGDESILAAYEVDYHDCACGMTEERAKLAAAAPAMARALCAVEDSEAYAGGRVCCLSEPGQHHSDDCVVDAALNAAGLDAAAREAVRAAAER